MGGSSENLTEMPERSLRRYGMLDDDERLVRPQTIRQLTFDDLTRPGPTFRDSSDIIPIESARAGDAQVLAARSPKTSREHVIDLDGLSQYLSVTSIVATTRVQARQLLPQISELLLFGDTPLPDAETLRLLPGLKRVWLTWARGGTLSLELLPRDLQALGVARHHIVPAPGADRFSALHRFDALTRLTLWY